MFVRFTPCEYLTWPWHVWDTRWRGFPLTTKMPHRKAMCLLYLENGTNMNFPVKWFMQHQIGNVVARVHVHGTCIPPRVPTTRALSGNFKERNECLLYLAKFCSPGLTYFDRNAPATPTRWKAKAYKVEASEKELLSKGDIQIVIELLSRLGGIIKIIDPEMRPLYPKSPVTHELRDRHSFVYSGQTDRYS